MEKKDHSLVELVPRGETLEITKVGEVICNLEKKKKERSEKRSQRRTNKIKICKIIDRWLTIEFVIEYEG